MSRRLWPRVLRWDEVRARAYERWLIRQRTGAPGSDYEDWILAVQDLS